MEDDPDAGEEDSNGEDEEGGWGAGDLGIEGEDDDDEEEEQEKDGNSEDDNFDMQDIVRRFVRGYIQY